MGCAVVLVRFTLLAVVCSQVHGQSKWHKLAAKQGLYHRGGKSSLANRRIQEMIDIMKGKSQPDDLKSMKVIPHRMKLMMEKLNKGKLINKKTDEAYAKKHASRQQEERRVKEVARTRTELPPSQVHEKPTESRKEQQKDYGVLGNLFMKALDVSTRVLKGSSKMIDEVTESRVE